MVVCSGLFALICQEVSRRIGYVYIGDILRQKIPKEIFKISKIISGNY